MWEIFLRKAPTPFLYLKIICTKITMEITGQLIATLLHTSDTQSGFLPTLKHNNWSNTDLLWIPLTTYQSKLHKQGENKVWPDFCFLFVLKLKIRNFLNSCTTSFNLVCKLYNHEPKELHVLEKTRQAKPSPYIAHPGKRKFPTTNATTNINYLSCF